MGSKTRNFAAVLLLLISVDLSAKDEVRSEGETLVVAGGTLVDGYGGKPLPNAVVVIRDGRFVQIGTHDSIDIPPSARIIDANGKTMLPGLWESHGHLEHAGEGDPATFPRTFSERRRDIMAAAAKTTVMAGITSFRDTGGPLEEQLALREAIRSGELPGPRLFLAGPILRQWRAGRLGSKGRYDVDSVASARRVTQELIELGADQVKVYGQWDLDVLTAVTGAAHEKGVGVDADVRHPSAYSTALDAGVDRLHHVFTADPLASYSDDELRQLVRGTRISAVGPMANIVRGPYIIPTIEMRASYARVFSFPEILDDPVFSAQYPRDIYRHLKRSWRDPNAVPWGLGAEQRVAIAKRKIRAFVEAGGREQIVAGTDAGSPFNFHSPLTRELRQLSEVGLAPMEVIQSATLRPAQMQGVEEQLGTVSVGKLADMIIVDGDPLQDIAVLVYGVETVIKGGRIIKQPG